MKRSSEMNLRDHGCKRDGSFGGPTAPAVVLLCCVVICLSVGCSSKEATGGSTEPQTEQPVRTIDREALMDAAPEAIQEAKQAVAKFDGVVADHGGHVSIALDFSRTSLGDDDLARLDFPESVTSINLAETKITDTGLPHLVRAQNLKTLDLRHTAVTDKGIDVIKQLDKLSHVDLEGCANVSRGKRLELVKFLSPRSAAHEHERRMRALNQSRPTE